MDVQVSAAVESTEDSLAPLVFGSLHGSVRVDLSATQRNVHSSEHDTDGSRWQYGMYIRLHRFQLPVRQLV